MLSYARPAAMRQQRSGRQRSLALALTLLLHILVFALLLLHRSEPVPVKLERPLTAFTLLPQNKEKGEHKQAQRKAQARKSARKVSKQQAQVQKPTPPPVPTPPTHTEPPLNFIQLSRSDYAASNIGRIESRKAAPPSSSNDQNKSTYGPSEGPGGATIYPADWYRRPTDVELGGYLRPGQPSQGWGQIACKTEPHFRVDNCFIMGESPAGSGFGLSVLNASWQFLVLPPEINGHPQIGTWVSIRITYTPAGAKLGPG